MSNMQETLYDPQILKYYLVLDREKLSCFSA